MATPARDREASPGATPDGPLRPTRRPEVLAHAGSWRNSSGRRGAIERAAGSVFRAAASPPASFLERGVAIDADVRPLLGTTVGPDYSHEHRATRSAKAAQHPGTVGRCIASIRSGAPPHRRSA